jgi:uncharacterized protein YecE (DUF72 family)
MSLYVGTSGYSYKEWKGSFYPPQLAPKDMLSYYASKLPAVELNNTFYRLPQPSMIESWKAQVPENFRFAVKASRSITLFRRLKDAAEITKKMLETVSAFGDRLGAVLYRLPDDMEKDLGRLKTFLKTLPPDPPAAFDFRHPSWFDDDVLELLRSENRALCISDRDERPVSRIDKTADWGYVRLRRVNYSTAELREWSSRMKAQDWKHTFVFFKHEDEGTGPRLASEFIGLSR